MALSGSYDKSTTAKEIVREAFALINAQDDGEPLSADRWAYGLSQLNKLMSALSIHRGLWLLDEVQVTLTPGTTSYTVGVGETVDTPVPMLISQARRYNDIDIEVDIVSRSDYMAIPNKTLQAPPNLIYYHKQRDYGTLYVWPTGDTSNTTLYITTQRPVQDFDHEGNNPDFPKEWVLPVEYMLAEMIAPKYRGGVPQDIRMTALQLRTSLFRYDEEKVEVAFQPCRYR